MNVPATIATMSSVVAYDAMCSAIELSESTAACKDIIDKTAALKEYARRINNIEAERRACNVRLIAERRYGELMKLLVRTHPVESGTNQHRSLPAAGGDLVPYSQALADTGVSTQAASRYQALAAVPKEIFDQALHDPVVMPSTRKLIDAAREPQMAQMPTDSLWLWGRMRDFERERFTEKDCGALLEPMTLTMKADMARILPSVAEFFSQLLGEIQ